MEWYPFPTLLLLALLAPTVSAVPLIKAPWGAMQGISVEGDGGRIMNAYMGIPYAVPPLGELRFEKPLPHPGPGEGEVFMADKQMPACPQPPLLIGDTAKTSEDCLMLNVYVPVEGDTDRPYAVMIFIHGGAFYAGDAYSYRPSKLVVDGRVIVVIIQYRLGALGFLTSGDGVLPGNAGLWDQTLAIRWVKDNIQSFGGDPSRITIFGESAGSMSVGLQMLSPHSKGLFQRGFMQSGAPHGWALQSKIFDQNAVFKDLADLFECQGGTTAELVKCMKAQGEEEFLNKTVQYASTSPQGTFYFPAIDGDFIPRDPVELVQDEEYMKSNGIDDIDVVMGFNNKEGALLPILMSLMNMTEEVLLSSEYFHNISESCLVSRNLGKNPVMFKTIAFFYQGADASSSTSKTWHPLSDMNGECNLSADILDWVRRLADSCHSAGRYMYVFDHDFAVNDVWPVQGSHHGDELLLEFDNSVELPESGLIMILKKTAMAPEEQPLSDLFVQILTSFAKTGNPNPEVKHQYLGDTEWPIFERDSEAYLSLSMTPEVVPKAGPYKDRLALWLNLLPELSRLTSELKPSPEGETADGQDAPGSPKEEL